MKKYIIPIVTVLCICLLASILIKTYFNKTIDRGVDGGDHLYHIQIKIKDIENYKILSAEVIDGGEFLAAGEQCNIDISEGTGYEYYKTFNAGDVIEAYFFPNNLEKTEAGNVLTLDDFSELKK